MNTDCRRFQESYSDADMSDELKRHGESCESCQEFVLRQNALQQILPGWKTPEISSDFALDVMSRIAEDGERRRSPLELLKEMFNLRFSIPLPIGALAGILFLVSVLMNVFFWASNDSTSNFDPSRLASNPNAPAVDIIPTIIQGANVMHTSDFNSESVKGFMSATQGMPGAGLFLLVPIVEPNLPMTSIEKTNNQETENKQEI